MDSSQASCSPTRVVIQIATQVVIPNFSAVYETVPLEDFSPSYFALDDGSLLAMPYQADLAQALLSLIVLSIVLIFFIRNIGVTGYYFFVRSKIIQDRRLFLAMFVSQLVSPLGLLPTMASYFSSSSNCTTVLRVERFVSFLSLSIIVSGILGFKSYRVLSNSRLVLVLVCTLQAVSTVMVALDIRTIRGMHRLSGSCSVPSISPWIIASVIVQLAQTILIALCFLISVFKAKRSPVGRVLIDRPEMNGPTQSEKHQAPDSVSTPFRRVLSQSAVSDVPSRHSLASRISDFIPKMDSIFHSVMKDELLFTTMIAFLSILAVVFTLVGLNNTGQLSFQGWVSIPWCFISVIVIKSFDKALGRHENGLTSLCAPPWAAYSPAFYQPPPPSGSSLPSTHLSFARISNETSNPFTDPTNSIASSDSDISRSTISSQGSASYYARPLTVDMGRRSYASADTIPRADSSLEGDVPFGQGTAS